MQLLSLTFASHLIQVNLCPGLFVGCHRDAHAHTWFCGVFTQGPDRQAAVSGLGIQGVLGDETSTTQSRLNELIQTNDMYAMHINVPTKANKQNQTHNNKIIKI